VFGHRSPGGLFDVWPGPFNIVKNENLISVSNSRILVPNIVLPVGPRVAVDEVVRIIEIALRAADAGILVQNSRDDPTVGRDGFLIFTDLFALGSESRIVVRGSAAAALGLDLQTATNGRVLFPGWTLERRVDFNPEFVNRHPKFLASVKSNPVFKLSYTVPGERCLRCRATYVENDWRFNRQGAPIFIANEDLLVQAAQKIVLTRKGSNPFEPWYGTKIHEKVGAKQVGATALTIHEEVTRALDQFQQLQRAQSDKGKQEVSLRERLFTVLSVNTTPDPQDQTLVRVDILLANASGRPVTLSIVFTTPGAVALAGSNNLSLGLGISSGEQDLIFNT